MHLRLFVIFIQIVLLLLANPSFAIKHSLGGSVELRYAEHTAEEGGAEVLNANHFVQQYELLWEGTGQLSEGRAGKYDLALGYQWNQVDSEINGAEVKIDNPLDKIIFKGDLLLAPGGLPFRFHLYSYDMNRPSLGYRELGELFSGQDYDGQQGIVSTVQSGSYVITGMTLMAGVKNGFSRGIYRDALNAMPRLFIDFRQADVRDIDGPTPLYYTDRDLAFVSLNKNKNWFHYRFFTHTDKIDPSNDYEEQSYLLGTIDHLNRRQWIDLTNWIQMSTDVSYTETTPNPNAQESYQERYDYNLFMTAQRANWSGGTYTSFSRIRDNNSLSKSLEIPILAKGRLNRDTTWRVRLESSRAESSSVGTGTETKEDNLFLASRLEAFSQSRYVVSPILDLEHKDGSRGRGLAFRAGVEVYNNQRYRTDTDLFGSYTVIMIDGTAESGEGVSYWEQQLKGQMAKDLNPSLRTSFEQDLVLGGGVYNGSTSDYIQASIDAIASDSNSSAGTVDGAYYRSITSWSIDYRPPSRIYNRVELKYDYLDSAVTSGGQLSIFHNVNYYGRSLKASMDNELILGRTLFDKFNEDVDLVGGSSIVRTSGVVDKSFASYGRVDYAPGRNYQSGLSFELEWRAFERGGSDQRYRVTQEYKYSFWKDRGLLRKLAVLGEELEYEDYSPAFGNTSSLLGFTLFSELYPTRQTLLSARLRYEIDSVDRTDVLLVFLTAAVDFEKFQLSFDYAYGTRTAGINGPQRIEHKWEMKVKKTF
ncbi:MAG: hypothetical protein GXP51_09180 [Deltaproteobacteria bacterium]|nr:hypothetical protein [Deltaproteobacteria bacterium]